MRVLRYNRHWSIPTPFICIETSPGCAEIISPRPRTKVEARIHIAAGDHSGREELHPDDWTPAVARKWAKFCADKLMGK